MECDTFIQRAAKSKFRKKTVELVVLMDLQPFLQKTAKEKNKAVWCFFVYISTKLYTLGAKNLKK